VPTPAGEKKFYTLPNLGATPTVRLYLVCLSVANSIFSKGCPCIAHGSQPLAYYKALLYCQQSVAINVIPSQKAVQKQTRTLVGCLF
jgi:hypothetical protein